MIDMYAGAGFDILRVPVTWGSHMGPAPEWTIDREWMARVKEIVDWGLDAGMTVMLNVHHDFDWMRPELSLLVDWLPRYRRLWQQIAEEFAEYGDELIFQGSNEPNLHGGENCAWGSGTPNVRAGINVLNHTFVRTVREMGGKNATRWLAIPNLAARPLPECMQDMIMPKDDKLIYTIHCYCPDNFVFQRDEETNTAVFDEKACSEVYAMFADIKKWAVPHGLPIMFTEWGAVAKRLPNGDLNNEERIRFAEVFLKCAAELDVPCVWWDNNYLERGDEYFALFDRESLTCHCPELVKTLIDNRRPV
jgi:endoglucanase